MKLSTFKESLNSVESLSFLLPSGKQVPAHFHVTEVGLITKHFIDCGGAVRNEKVVNFQLWEAADFDHRLAPEKMLKILGLPEKILGDEDLEIEVEYQSDTIGKYGLEFDGTNYQLTSKQTNCLASDHCGIPVEKLKKNLVNLVSNDKCCTPGGGCC